jgi:hypothetical protein
MKVTAWACGLALGMVGCAGTGEVRYVYQDGQSGVIGLPENSSHWPTYYHQRAEELMAKHFPEGYEIVRAEEVEEGSRTLTVNGTNTAVIDPGTSSRLLAVGSLGRTSTRSQSDTMKIKECRILYKKAESRDTAKRGDYAERASWSPEFYVDPNAKAHKPPAATPRDAKEPALDPPNESPKRSPKIPS